MVFRVFFAAVYKFAVAILFGLIKIGTFCAQVWCTFVILVRKIFGICAQSNECVHLMCLNIVILCRMIFGGEVQEKNVCGCFFSTRPNFQEKR